jgi:hypothetical protein
MQWTSHCLPKSQNSLFAGPGKLWITRSDLIIPTLVDAHKWDLSLFKVQVIDVTTQPIEFNQKEILKYSEAQHKLRLISYYYGSRYYSDYCMKKGGTGAFLEHHPFIQFITPLECNASGFIIVGRYLKDKSLQLISLQIPFGFSLIVNPHAIHGDTNLKGLYLMGMTGNHEAMSTADTVFLYHPTGPVCIKTDQPIKETSRKKMDLLVTHDKQPYQMLKKRFSFVEKQIYNNVRQKLGHIYHAFWSAKIVNPFFYWPNVHNQI